MTMHNDNKKWYQKKKNMYVIIICLCVIGIGIVFSIANGGKENSSESLVAPTPANPDENLKDSAYSNFLMEDVGEWYDSSVLGGEISRTSIVSITFLDTMEDIPQNCWDVSKNKDKSVVAWVTKNGYFYDLYIASQGKIYVENCRALFGYYKNVEKIQFNGCLDTSHVTDMSDMFYRCLGLAKI